MEKNRKKIISLIIIAAIFFSSINLHEITAYAATDNLNINISVSRNDIKPGEKVTFTAKAAGGTAPYSYSYLVHNKDTNAWFRLTPSFTGNAAYSWIAGSSGNREFFAEVKDSTGKVVRSQAVNVKTSSLKIMGKTNADTIAVGDKVTISGEASGGSGRYLYSYLIHNKDTNAWFRFTSFIQDSSYVWTAGSAGNREFFVEAKDETGKVVRSSSVNVTAVQSTPLAISGNANVENIQVGDRVTISGTASGGIGTYTYSFLIHNTDTNSWYRSTSFSVNHSYVWTAGSSGNREFFVEVKDRTGKVVRSNPIPVTVADFKENELNTQDSEWLIQSVKNPELRFGVTYDSIEGEMPDNCKVCMRTATGTTKHHWEVEELNQGGGYKFRATRDSDKNCLLAVQLGVDGKIGQGDSVSMIDAEKAENSVWDIRSLKDGSYVILLRNTEYALTIDENMANDSVVTLQIFQASNERQHFTIGKAATGISITEYEQKIPLSLDVGKEETYQLHAVVASTDALDKTVLWESTDKDTAEIDANGVVTPKKSGIVKFVATAKDGAYTAHKSIRIYRSNSDTAVGGPKLISNLSGTYRLGTTWPAVQGEMPDDCAIQMRDITGTTKHHWYIQQRVLGGYKILAERDGDRNCAMAVNKGADGIINRGDTIYMAVDVERERATWIFYKMYDNSYAILLQGTQLALTIDDRNGADSAVTLENFDVLNENQHFKIDAAVKEISINVDSINLKKGENYQLQAEIAPVDALVKGMIWSTENSAVATVSQTGIVSGVAAGTTVIVVTSEDGKYTDRVTVTVKESQITDSELQRVIDVIGKQIDDKYTDSEVMCSVYCMSYVRGFLYQDYRSPDTYWSKSGEGAQWSRYGGTSRTGNVLATAKQYIDNKKPVIIHVRWTYGTHYVVAYGYSNSGSNLTDYNVIDPWDGTIKKLSSFSLYGDNQIITFE